MFENVSKDYDTEYGGERHVRQINENCWISVLYRLTGFGFMEWETAICFSDPITKRHIEDSPFIVKGDWREELKDTPENELMDWYNNKKSENKTHFDMLLDILKEAVKANAEEKSNT